MSLTYLDPTDQPESTDHEMCERPESLNGSKIGLLDNGKTKAGKLLEYVAEKLDESFDDLEFEILEKPSPFKPAPEDLLQDVSVKYGAVITGIGD